MAALFKEILGSMLISEPLAMDATRYPSPSQLLRRIIIKHRKIDATENDRVSDRQGKDKESGGGRERDAIR